jgi:hypothetical protein
MKQYLVILCLPLLILTSCNSDDGGGPSTPAAPVVFKANRLDNTGQTTAWSLPTVSATMSFFDIEITATNPANNEQMIISLPNDGVGQYFSQNTGNTSITAYITGQDTLISVYPSNNAFTLVEITEIDTVAKTMEGTFSVGVYDPMDNTNFYIFQEGVFENIPYTETTFGMGESTMTAQVNGAVFTPATILTVEFGNAVQISASSFTGQSIQISFPTNLAPGTYGLGTNSANPAHTGIYTVGLTSAFAQTGTLVITSNNAATSTIVGTFNFQAATLSAPITNYSITNGTFTAEY